MLAPTFQGLHMVDSSAMAAMRGLYVCPGHAQPSEHPCRKPQASHLHTDVLAFTSCFLTSAHVRACLAVLRTVPVAQPVVCHVGGHGAVVRADARAGDTCLRGHVPGG